MYRAVVNCVTIWRKTFRNSNPSNCLFEGPLTNQRGLWNGLYMDFSPLCCATTENDRGSTVYFKCLNRHREKLNLMTGDAESISLFSSICMLSCSVCGKAAGDTHTLDELKIRRKRRNVVAHPNDVTESFGPHVGRWLPVRINSRHIGLEFLNRKINHTNMASIGRKVKSDGRTRVSILQAKKYGWMWNTGCRQ